MKRKLLCLILALAMTVPMLLTGCLGDDETDTKDEGEEYVENTPMTLSLYSITNESTTEEAKQLVEDAMNEYTESRYNTHIELHLYTEDEYYNVIDEKLQRGPGSVPAVEEGQTYPAEADDQCDIFLVTNYAKLNEYALNKYTAELDSALESDYKLVLKYVNEALMSAAKVNWTTSWMPNNGIVGDEYTYLLVNRDLMNKYYYAESDFASLDDVKEFLGFVTANDTGYIPVYNEPADLTEPLNDSISILGAFVANSATQSTLTPPRLRLSVGQFKTRETTLCNWYSSGMIVTGDPSTLPAGRNIATAFISGEMGCADKYSDDYAVITYRKPVASSTELYSSGYCVSAYTKDSGRCMEILADLATKPTLCNIFQYGVEDVHYQVDELTGVYNIISDDYSMDLKNTGNMFLLKQNNRMDEQMLAYSADDWKLAKEKNLDTVVSPWCAFSVTLIDEFTNPDYKYIYTAEVLENLEKLSEDYMARVKSYEQRAKAGEAVDMESYLTSLANELSQNKYVVDALNTENVNSIVGQYTSYYEVNFAS